VTAALATVATGLIAVTAGYLDYRAARWLWRMWKRRPTRNNHGLRQRVGMYLPDDSDLTGAA